MAFNQISTAMMKTLLDDTVGLTKILIEKGKTENQSAQAAAAASAVLLVIAQAVWGSFPSQLLIIARALYGEAQEHQHGSADWVAFCASLDVKLSGAKGLWTSHTDLEDFLQMRTKYMQCLFLTITETLAQLTSDHKNDALCEPSQNLKQYFENATNFLKLCSAEVSSVDCQQEEQQAWEILWLKVLSQAQSVMDMHVKLKSETEWQRKHTFHKVAANREKVQALKAELAKSRPHANVDGLSKEQLAEVVAEDRLSVDKEQEKIMADKFDKLRDESMKAIAAADAADGDLAGFGIDTTISTLHSLPPGTIAALFPPQESQQQAVCSDQLWFAQSAQGRSGQEPRHPSLQDCQTGQQ